MLSRRVFPRTHMGSSQLWPYSADDYGREEIRRLPDDFVQKLLGTRRRVGQASGKGLKSDFRIVRMGQPAAPHRRALRSAGLRPAATPDRSRSEIIFENHSRSGFISVGG